MVPAPTDGQALQHFGDEDEERDDQGRERLADGQGGRQGERHRQLHRHPPGQEVRQRLLEDRVASDQHGGPGDHVEAGVWLPDPEPDGDGGDAHQGDARRVRPLQRVVVVFVVGGMLVSLGAAVSRRLVHVHRDAPFESSAISNTP